MWLSGFDGNASLSRGDLDVGSSEFVYERVARCKVRKEVTTAARDVCLTANGLFPLFTLLYIVIWPKAH